MTDHVIQHTDISADLTVCSTSDGQEIVVQMGKQRVNLAHKNAADWFMSFTLLALAPPAVIAKMIEEVPPEFEDARPFLNACLKSPDGAASFALLFKFALDDAYALRTAPTAPPGLGDLGGLLR
jgi:hypothetical protein